MNQMSMTMTAQPGGGKQTDPINTLLGRRMADARIAAGVNQASLGEALGVTFQQIQKYETGANRISAAAIVRMAAHLRLPPHLFFDGFEPEGHPIAPPAITRDQRALIDDYRSLTNPEIKEGLRRLIRILAADARAQREKTL